MQQLVQQEAAVQQQEGVEELWNVQQQRVVQQQEGAVQQ